VRLWQVSDSTLLQTYGDPTKQIRAIAVLWDRRTLALGADGRTNLWQVSDASPMASLNSLGVTSLAFSSDGTLLALGTLSGQLELRRVEDGVLLVAQEGHRAAVMSLVFSSDAM